MFRFSAEAAYLLLVAHEKELIGDGAPSKDKASIRCCHKHQGVQMITQQNNNKI